MQSDRDHSSKQKSSLYQIPISILIVLHFCAILICYSGNWRKSSSKNDLISRLHPYLIGLNWYVELFPVDWTLGDSNDGGVTRLVLHCDASDQKEPMVLFQSDSRRSDRERERYLLSIMELFAAGGEDDGAALLFASAVNRAERVSGLQFQQIVLERKSTDESQRNREPKIDTVYAAQIVRVDGSLRLIPKIESQRTVISLAKKDTNP